MFKGSKPFKLKNTFKISIIETGGFSNKPNVLLHRFNLLTLSQKDFIEANRLVQNIINNDLKESYFIGDTGYKIKITTDNYIIPITSNIYVAKPFTKIPKEMDQLIDLMSIDI